MRGGKFPKLARGVPLGLAVSMRRLFIHGLALLALVAPVTLLAAPGDAPPPSGPYYVAQFDPILLHFPASWPLGGIRWYGLAYVVGFLIASWLMWLYAKKGRLPLNADERSVLFSALVLGVLVGGRIGHLVLYDLFGDPARRAEFLSNPLLIFEVWKGGMASHGGMIGVVIAAWWFSRHSKMSFLSLGDLAATLAPPGLLLGRLANFVNGELWGKATTVPWAMIFPIRDGESIIGYTGPVHPSQLYEAATEGLLLMIYTQWRWWSKPPPGQPGALPAGQLGGEFLILYAFVRIFCEMFREPDATLFFGLSRGTFYSLFMILLGGGIIMWKKSRVPATQNP
jgi:phosphatidylglycerol:prolipoprotein diacylglycerol transferase